jgi:hypothetical protein
MCITEFFGELDTDWTHDGSTRHRWVTDLLESMLAAPHDGPADPPENFCRVIDHLMNPGDATNEGPGRRNALQQLNEVLIKEGFEAFHGRTSAATCGTLAPKRSPRWRRTRTGAHHKQRWSAAKQLEREALSSQDSADVSADASLSAHLSQADRSVAHARVVLG